MRRQPGLHVPAPLAGQLHRRDLAGETDSKNQGALPNKATAALGSGSREGVTAAQISIGKAARAATVAAAAARRVFRANWNSPA
jgi:hypothetical protein